MGRVAGCPHASAWLAAAVASETPRLNPESASLAPASQTTTTSSPAAMSASASVALRFLPVVSWLRYRATNPYPSAVREAGVGLAHA